MSAGGKIDLRDLSVAKAPPGTLMGSDGVRWKPVGGVGAPSWFDTATTQVITGDVYSWIEWRGPITDGVAAGTDFEVDGTDSTHLNCLKAGTYLVSMNVTQANMPSGPVPYGYNYMYAYVAINNDSVGPGYYMDDQQSAPGRCQLRGIPLVLAVGDYLRLRVLVQTGIGTTGHLNGGAYAAILRLT